MMDRSRVFRRAGRRTNLALLVLFVGTFLTGWLAFAAGTPVPATLATVAHGVFGIAIVALVPWKSVIINRASGLRLASLGLLMLILICLAAGFVQVVAGFGYLAGLSPIQVHVGAAVLAVPLFGWHLLRHRVPKPRSADLSRRALLRTGLFVVAAGAGYALVLGVARWVQGPARDRVATGSLRLDPAAIPATIWLLDPVPEIDAAAHRVAVAGRLWSVSELERKAGPPFVARLDCTSGWYAEASWTGVSIAELIAPERLVAAASIEVRSVTGYTRHFPVAEAGALWLATRCQGQPLFSGTGAPVRLVAPNRRGFWWVKWVDSVQLSDQPAWLQSPFPV
jgi:DMSO/TMAO reductase YedYZ molybdopterin-dependent catalytic subunit